MISIASDTKKFIENLAKSYNIAIIWDPDSSSTFQEQVSKNNRTMKIKENIKIEDFDYLFQQHSVDYEVERDQEMFVFNALHGIGHFELNLWKPHSGNDTADRLVNFEQDQKIDKWAFALLENKVRKEFLESVKKTN